MKRKSKDIVAERLDYLMKSRATLGTQMKLAKKTGIGQTTIGRIRRGEVNATAENLRAIATAFDVPVGFFFDDEPYISSLENPNWASDRLPGAGPGRPPGREGQLPLISWVQAGAWNEIINNFHPGDADEWLYCPFKHSDTAFVLKVVGQSMYNPGGDRSYNDGDYIAVDPERQAVSGNMVVVRLNDDNTATFKQLLIEPNGDMMLMALNPSWPNRIIKIGNDATICGVVIGKWTDEI